jgi:hypothetical protein
MPNTRIIRYEEAGKTYDGFFVEQSRAEVTKEISVKEHLVNEGISEEVAQTVAAILKAGEII